MVYRGALLHVSFFTDIDNGKKATPVVANRFREICGQAPLGLCACKIQVGICFLEIKYAKTMFVRQYLIQYYMLCGVKFD